MFLRKLLTGILLSSLVVYILPTPLFVGAQSTITELQGQISERNNRLSEIEKEIAQFEAALREVGAEKQTLQKAIDRLELERDKVQADISYTQNKITNTDLEISKLNLEINKAEESVEQNERAIGQILRVINANDNESLLTVLLRHKNISEFWGAVENLETVKNSMSNKVTELNDLKEVLTVKKDEETKKRGDLVTLKSQYSDQQAILQNNKKEKDQLLEETQSEEAAYQALLEEKRAVREQLNRELREFEAELQFILDPTTIPTRGTAVFNWPLENVIITQRFGGTEFAKNNPGIYGRGYHPGLDLGAAVGTKILAPLSGTVRWTDNTDAIAGCYAWGKWILIDHANGLSTLYAHLSHISVTPGQQVSTGEVIGYTGATGYVTGPHLHFTVYAKDAVEVIRYSDFKTITSCGPAYTPRAASEGYIDPESYLPPL